MRLPTCMIVGLAVLASGCGSTKTASVYVTASTSTNAGTTAPAGSSAQSATQSTNSTQAPQTTATKAKAESPRAPEAKPERKQPASGAGAQAVTPGNGSGEVLPPRSRRYPRFFQLKFISSCEAAGGSHSSCECILITQEKRNVEKGQSMAELLALDLELRRGISLQKAAHHGVLLPSGVQRSAEACGTSK